MTEKGASASSRPPGWDDRQALARQVADLRDENAELRRRLRDAEHNGAVQSVKFDVLSVAAEDEGRITEGQVERLADLAWAAIDRRYWPEDDA